MDELDLYLYRLEGDKWVTKVDVSWNPAWNGTDQVRFYKLDTLGFLDGISAGIVANADARSTPAFREGVKRFTSRKKDKS